MSDEDQPALQTIHELRAHVGILEEHVARLESIIQVMLEEIEAGTIQETAKSIREALASAD
jgi:predicted transcriptional regulator